MRAFSDLEKKLIRKMIELDNKVGILNVLGNIIYPFYDESNLPVDCYVELESEKDIFIKISSEALTKNSPEWLHSVDDNISKKLLSIVALFDYLETKKLAYFVGNLNLNRLGEMHDNMIYTECEFLDDDLKPAIYKYARKKIFVSETLRVFVNNDFKTDEELRHERELSSISKQLKFTRIALGATFLGLLVSILVPILVTSAIDIKNERLVTDLSPNTIEATQVIISKGITPIVEDISRVHEQLAAISSAIQHISEERLLHEQKYSESLEMKMDELIKAISATASRIKQPASELHKKKNQPSNSSASAPPR